jgi:hypothetical protein
LVRSKSDDVEIWPVNVTEASVSMTVSTAPSPVNTPETGMETMSPAPGGPAGVGGVASGSNQIVVSFQSPAASAV